MNDKQYRMDCKGPEPATDDGMGTVCRWCGRPIYQKGAGWRHRRDYSRRWPDPRKAGAT